MARVECFRCEGDGFGSDGGNCGTCQGSGKVESERDEINLLRQSLYAIATVKRSGFTNLDDFFLWAQSVARAALAGKERE
jgi:hypothetical protein